MTGRKLFAEDEIEGRVGEVASAIAEAVPQDLLMIGVLKGSFVFMADLMRRLDDLGLRPAVDFLRLSSYGHAMESSGEVKLIGPLPQALPGRAVLLVDDIVDTGHSLVYGRDLLLGAGAKRVWTCVLLDKPSRREIVFEADFVGFTIPDIFVVGYGIDYAEKYRHLRYIRAVE